jgi:hypothetical protein
MLILRRRLYIRPLYSSWGLEALVSWLYENVCVELIRIILEFTLSGKNPVISEA